LLDDQVVTFEPETGAVEELSTSLEGWADRILKDYALLTGFPLAHEWQQRQGQLAAGKRLLPKRPFVLGGEYTLENLYELDATQLKNLPDGTTVKFNVIE
jgi:hypothetical protein